MPFNNELCRSRKDAPAAVQPVYRTGESVPVLHIEAGRINRLARRDPAAAAERPYEVWDGFLKSMKNV